MTPHPFRFGIQCRASAHGAGWRALARQVEDLGYSTLTIADHFDDGFAPIPALMAAADATTSLRVGTMVLANDYRHPVVLAKEAATLDVLSGGRFELGLGAGWMATDYAAAGMALESPGRRVDRLEESLHIIREIFGTHPVHHDGSHYRITDLVGHPQPLTPGGPKIVVGGGGKRVLRLAAHHADVVALNVNLGAGVMDARAFPDGTPEATDRKIRWVREAAGERLGDIELQVRVHLAMITEDRAGVIEELAPAFHLTPAEAAATPHAMVGTVPQIAEQLLAQRERWGISYLGVSGDQLDALAPVVAQLAGT